MPGIPVPDFIPSSQDEESTPVQRAPIPKEESSTDKPSLPEEAALERSERDAEQELPIKDEISDIKYHRQSKSPRSNTIAPPPNTLPPPLLSLLQTIQSTLSHSFPASPPHTAQRLAELLLRPRTHYRTLPSYLRALDRIVSVASPASIFPLPDLMAGTTTNGRMLNGTSSPSPGPTSDENFIGGAELTEIPWLRNTVGSPPASILQTNAPASDLRTESTSLIDGPNGAGSVETVTVNVNGISNYPPREENTHGITQGELLRQEQEAGIVPVPSSPHNGRVTRSSAAATAAASRAVGLEPDEGIGLEEEAETVHARGPGIIGMEDMGPQAPSSGLAGGLDLEGALGRRGEGETIVGRSDEAREREEEKDGDGDVVVADADGVAEGDVGADASGENKGADAVDSTML